jgi:G3E family GTPase
MTAALPTTVLGGFLGAGKTTLVNHVLRHAEGLRITVLVNDFGELAIDLDLIEARGGGKLSLANGCACCATGGDLGRALNQLLDAPDRPDRLLIEASGVADPNRLADIARADPDLVLAGIVVVADRGRIVDLVADPRIGGQVARQFAAADLIVLNKQDLPGLGDP